MTSEPLSRLLFITCRKLSTRPLVQIVNEACAASVKLVQLREKDLDGKALYHLAKDLREMTTKHHAKLFINDRVDIALAVHADGVVLPEMSFPVQVVKKINGKFLVGRSVHSLDGAVHAEASGADFLLVGNIFETSSKPLLAARGLPLLNEIASAVKIPVFAVGGVTPVNARQCRQNGAFGVATMSELMQAIDVSKTASAFQEAVSFLDTN